MKIVGCYVSSMNKHKITGQLKYICGESVMLNTPITPPRYEYTGLNTIVFNKNSFSDNFYFDLMKDKSGDVVEIKFESNNPINFKEGFYCTGKLDDIKIISIEDTS